MKYIKLVKLLQKLLLQKMAWFLILTLSENNIFRFFLIQNSYSNHYRQAITSFICSLGSIYIYTRC